MKNNSNREENIKEEEEVFIDELMDFDDDDIKYENNDSLDIMKKEKTIQFKSIAKRLKKLRERSFKESGDEYEKMKEEIDDFIIKRDKEVNNIINLISDTDDDDDDSDIEILNIDYNKNDQQRDEEEEVNSDENVLFDITPDGDITDIIGNTDNSISAQEIYSSNVNDLSESTEDEQQFHHSPPPKRRRLNDSTYEPQQYYDNDDQYVLNQNGRNNKKRKRLSNNNGYSASTEPTEQTQQTQEIHIFGKRRYDDISIMVNPGAFVRLELVNFLCHRNFAITFHPSINVISGQNGSGKSAIEAGISMALGISAKKSGRGNETADVIRYNYDFAMIRLFLHNQGPDALSGYGKEIVIERKISRNAKRAISSFRVLDENLKQKGRGLPAVRHIVNNFNLNIENPSVVLKQSMAKRFLCSNNSADYFRFFMQASKLGFYQNEYEKAQQNVNEAKEQQKQTKKSGVAIQGEYRESKREYDALINNERNCEKIKFWKRAEKWMKYHKSQDIVNKHQQQISTTEKKIFDEKRKLKGLTVKMSSNMSRSETVEAEIQRKKGDLKKYETPMDEFKKNITELEEKRKDCKRKMSSKQKFIDRSTEKIEVYKKEYKNRCEELANGEIGRRLASIINQLNEKTEILHQYESKEERLERKTQETIDMMRDNESKLYEKNREYINKEEELKDIKKNLKQIKQQIIINQQQSRSELFIDPRINKQVSIKLIRDELQRNHQKFGRPPIGPLGEYIQMIPHEDKNIMDCNIKIVQTVVGKSIYAFLVDTSEDQHIFKQIMWNKWQIVVPCIQYPYSDKMEVIHNNPFEKYRPSESDGPLLRVSDMFIIKDNNPWVYNAILTQCNPERVFAHGTLDVARQFVSNLNSEKLRKIKNVLTYKAQNGLYSVMKRGGSISGQPQKKQTPILQTDIGRLKDLYDNNKLIIREKDKELNEENKLRMDLLKLVQNERQQRTTFGEQLKKLKRNIQAYKDKINQLNAEKTEIEEEQDDDNLIEIQNNIDDEKLQIEQLQREISPFREQETALSKQIETIQKKLGQIQKKLDTEQNSIRCLKQSYQTILEQIQNNGLREDKIPGKICKLERELKALSDGKKEEESRMNRLYEAAKSMRPEVTVANYPRNDENGNVVFSLAELKQTRLRLAAQIEAWESLGNDQDDIRKRYELIKRKYEQHQAAIDKCENNVNKMQRLLTNRDEEYNRMKQCISERISSEFRSILEQQGYGGKISINYERKELEMNIGCRRSINSKTLSGGERSFIQIALIMALQKFNGSPICIYDEFDVFMDSINRGKTIKILLKTALNGHGTENNKQSTERQYIFITPNDVSPIIAEGHKNMIAIHKLEPPRK